MKWSAGIRDVVKEWHARGMLGVLGGLSQIPEYRLRDWATTKTIDNLSHVELRTLDDILFPQELANASVVTESEEQRTEELARFSARSGINNCEECSDTFDSSD
jgi:hypothetical protein